MALLVLGGGTWALLSRTAVPADGPVFTGGAVRAAALVLPGQVQVSSHRRAALSFQVSGTLKTIYVRVGQRVKAGQVLAVLHAANYRRAAAQAAAGLTQAQAQLARVEAPPTSRQQAQYAAQLAAAKAALENAQTGWADAQASYAQGMTDAKDQLSLAQQNLSNAQTAYDSAKQQADEANLQLGIAQAAYPSTALPVLQAHQAYDQAAAAQAQAQSQLAADQTAVQQAQAAVSNPVQLQAALDQARAQLNSAQHAYDQAQAAYELETGPAPATAVDVAQAAVTQAQASDAAAELAVSETRLVAPFAGSVTAVDGVLGGFAGPQTPTVELAAINPHTLRVYAQVAQESVGQVRPGARVVITSRDFPGRHFAGRVLSVAPAATAVQGISTYRVKLGVAGKGELKPGMSVEVHFPS